jgi:hypothetical protein
LFSGELTFIEERWLRKLTNIPKPNLSLSSLGRKGFNDDESLCRPITEQPIREISVDKDQTYGKCTKKIQPFVGLSEVFPPDCSTDDFIPRRTNTNYFRTEWTTANSFRNEEEMKERQKYENPEEMKHVREKLAKYFMEKYKCYTTEHLEVYSTFAQRMRDNTMAFEAFCLTNV